MLVADSDETCPDSAKTSDGAEKAKPSSCNSNSYSVDGDCSNGGDDESVLDVSGKSMEFSVVESPDEAVQGLYLYKNVFNLIPKEVGTLGRLRTLKFFGNEINLFPSEIGSMVGLEHLQVKISSPGFGGLPLHKLKGLKELELSRVPPRPSAFPILSEISGLSCLTKLSICHFSIRYLPSEIGCLKNLEYLDLSFNKLKSLPKEISNLSVLISLKVANNKLVELPPSLSSLQRLENLDLSNNKLTSLGSLELSLMQNLQNLNLQCNKLLAHCEIPSWICCNFEGSGREPVDNFVSSSVEMDLYDNAIQEYDGSLSRKGSHHVLPGLITASASNSRCFSARKSGKRWKRRYYLQQRARQERLNNSRKWKGIDHNKLLSLKDNRNIKPSSLDVLAPDTSVEGTSEVIGLDDDDKEILPGGDEGENLPNCGEGDDINLKKGIYAENHLCVSVESSAGNKGDKYESSENNESLASVQNQAREDEDSFSEMLQTYSKSKRHCDKDLDNPKPCKSRRAIDDSASLSRKYSSTSFCSIEDFLPDGFYDAGRDRPFMPLTNYEQSFHLDSREVILLDREKDEELDAIVISAQALLSRLKQLNCLTRDAACVNEFQIVSLLALFVSDHFGGSDKGAIIERTRKAVSGSNYRKPFVCTCSTGNSKTVNTPTKPTAESVEDIGFSDICEKSLRAIKERRNSIIVPLGTINFGVCRHRALLVKYLCDRMEPPILCELVRGYLDFMPHAWNIIVLKRGDSWVRMVVDACHPHDIREETDPEYYCRYIPLSRSIGSLSTGSRNVQDSSFPSLSLSDEILKASSTSLIRCKYGAVEAAAKVRTVDVCRTSANDIRNFEYGCLGEVRILGALKHSCIVEMYGHQISSNWIPSADDNPECRVLQSKILMEYIKGGSLKGYIEKLSKAGEKRVPVELALCMARDVASALVELHSKHIIHRDVKSENILIDLDIKKADGTPVVKICDFDRAVPLRSLLHTCCIAHVGIPPPDVCVGTPRWMAPEVLQAMHKSNVYGMEIDIWSFGCLLLEMLTLQIPYLGLSEIEIHDHLQLGKRPRLTDELEDLRSSSEPKIAQSGVELEEKDAELDALQFLVDLFCQCTEENPMDRPTAEELYEMLLSRTSNLSSTEV
ncbi:Serine/threonine protein kinase [Trema orientale]|uniref:Serine/threonine protein kinase n=1 Tax=Trema orientale TaxID=63057 RepID=A0A2P5FWB5_TREOI|nr:Serine/threonine protein kinase [Trema orientale]